MIFVVLSRLPLRGFLSNKMSEHSFPAARTPPMITIRKKDCRTFIKYDNSDRERAFMRMLRSNDRMTEREKIDRFSFVENQTTSVPKR